MSIFEPKHNTLVIENLCIVYDAFWDFNINGVLDVSDIEIKTIEDVSNCEYIYSDGESDIEKTNNINADAWDRIMQLVKEDAKKHDDITESPDNSFYGIRDFMVTSFE